MKIRACEARDIAAVCSIYNFYIVNTVITFEEVILSEDEMAARVNVCQKIFPWLVCEVDGEVVGYAYASRWKERSAYKNTVEVTVYLKNGVARKGYGRHLYSTLLEALRKLNVHVALGCIALPNDASVALHEACGFKSVAHFSEVGRKFERWLDVGYWEKKLSD